MSQTSPANVPAYHLNVGSDGSIGWYSYATNRWTKLTDPGFVPQREWHTIRVEATTIEAEVFVDGESVGTVTPSTTGVER